MTEDEEVEMDEEVLAEQQARETEKREINSDASRIARARAGNLLRELLEGDHDDKLEQLPSAMLSQVGAPSPLAEDDYDRKIDRICSQLPSTLEVLEYRIGSKAHSDRLKAAFWSKADLERLTPK